MAFAAGAGDEQPSSENSEYWIHEHSPAYAHLSFEGKWMLFYKRGQIDAAWARAKYKYHAGELPGVAAMKVSTNRDNPNATDPSTGVLIFYCGSIGDPEGTKEMGRAILKAMAYTGGGTTKKTKRIYFKLDAATMAGVYAARGHTTSTYNLSYAGIKDDGWQPPVGGGGGGGGGAAAAAAAFSGQGRKLGGAGARPDASSSHGGGGGGGGGAPAAAAAAAAGGSHFSGQGRKLGGVGARPDGSGNQGGAAAAAAAAARAAGAFSGQGRKLGGAGASSGSLGGSGGGGGSAAAAAAAARARAAGAFTGQGRNSAGR